MFTLCHSLTCSFVIVVLLLPAFLDFAHRRRLDFSHRRRLESKSRRLDTVTSVALNMRDWNTTSRTITLIVGSDRERVVHD